LIRWAWEIGPEEAPSPPILRVRILDVGSAASSDGTYNSRTNSKGRVRSKAALWKWDIPPVQVQQPNGGLDRGGRGWHDAEADLEGREGGVSGSERAAAGEMRKKRGGGRVR
jgi:hypothetical protein